MKKRGFTLIELLAVIIILAIIALIATPIVMRVVENSKKGAAERSAENYVKAVETTIVTERMNGNTIEDGLYILDSNGDVCLDEDCANKLIITMTGTKPSSGKVKIEGEKVIGYSVIIGEYKNKYGNYSILPSEYQEVEYLESTGTQYIDTDVMANTDIETDIVFSITEHNGYSRVFGATNISGSQYGVRKNSADGTGAFLGELLAKGQIGFSTFQEDTIYHLIFNQREDHGVYLNGQYFGKFIPDNYKDGTLSIYIFTQNQGNNFMKGRMYSCKIYNSILVRDFIPCYRKSDSKPGMYDTVNGVFYTNQGYSDDFIVGDDI